MCSKIRSGGSFANITSLLALVAALSGTAYAVSTVGKGEIKGKHIANGAIRPAHVNAGVIDPMKIGGHVVHSQPSDKGKARAAAETFLTVEGPTTIGGEEYGTETVTAQCPENADGDDYRVRHSTVNSPNPVLHLTGDRGADAAGYWNESSVRTIYDDDDRNVSVTIQVKTSGGSAWLELKCRLVA